MSATQPPRLRHRLATSVLRRCPLIVLLLLSAATPVAGQAPAGEGGGVTGEGRVLPLLVPALVASGGGLVLGWKYASRDMTTEAGAVMTAVALATAANATVLAAITDGPPTLGEAIGAAAVGAAAGILLAIPLARFADQHRGSPTAGIVVGFTLGQGLVSALIGAHNQRTRRTP